MPAHGVHDGQATQKALTAGQLLSLVIEINEAAHASDSRMVIHIDDKCKAYRGGK
jgi:hypothetical protein